MDIATHAVIDLHAPHAPSVLLPTLGPTDILGMHRILSASITLTEREANVDSAVTPYFPEVRPCIVPRGSPGPDAVPKRIDVLGRSENERRARVENRDGRKRARNQGRRQWQKEAINGQVEYREFPVVIRAGKRLENGKVCQLIRPVRSYHDRGIELAKGD